MESLKSEAFQRAVAVLSFVTKHSGPPSLLSLLEGEYNIEFDYNGSYPGEWEYQGPLEGGSMHCGMVHRPHPRALWEGLYAEGILGGALFHDPLRKFLCHGSCSSCVERLLRGELPLARCATCMTTVTPLAFPPTVRACVSFACLAPAMLTAEAMVRERCATTGAGEWTFSWRLIDTMDSTSNFYREGEEAELAHAVLENSGCLVTSVSEEERHATLSVSVFTGAPSYEHKALFWGGTTERVQLLFMLDSMLVEFGRVAPVDVVIPSRIASRSQFKVGHTIGEYLLSDTESTGGTFVNGERCQRRALQHGDEISGGDWKYVFQRIRSAYECAGAFR